MAELERQKSTELPRLAALAGLELPTATVEELASLRASIQAEGVLEPIVVSTGPARTGEIADGRLRSQICTQLGLDCPRIARAFLSEHEFQLYRLTVNLERRQLSVVQRVRIGMLLEPHHRQLAAARRSQAAGQPRGQKTLPVALPEEKGETRQHVAHQVGLKASTYARGRKVLAEGSAELVADLETGRDTINSAWRRLQAEQRRAQIRLLADQLNRKPPPLPQGRYRVLVIDPPWPYEHGLPYPTMTLDQIANLPIGDLLEDEAIVWLWTTNRFHHDAEQIARQTWSLEYRNTLTWDKQRPGTGVWLRGQTEHCLLYTKGNPIFQADNDTTLIRERARQHSRKPEAFYQLVERTSPGTKLELFARQPRPGWTSWGGEPNHFQAASDPDQQAA